MAIRDAYKANFEALRQAFGNEDVALVECTDKKTRATVIALCTVAWDDTTEEYTITPFAKLFDGNPYEELAPPTEG
jgi:hypothetical protein